MSLNFESLSLSARRYALEYMVRGSFAIAVGSLRVMKTSGVSLGSRVAQRFNDWKFPLQN